MGLYDELNRQIEQLQASEALSLVELRNLLLEIEEYINGEEYQGLAPAQRSQLQARRKEVIQLMEGQENQAQAEGAPPPALDLQAQVSSAPPGAESQNGQARRRK